MKKSILIIIILYANSFMMIKGSEESKNTNFSDLNQQTNRQSEDKRFTKEENMGANFCENNKNKYFMDWREDRTISNGLTQYAKRYYQNAYKQVVEKEVHDFLKELNIVPGINNAPKKTITKNTHQRRRFLMKSLPVKNKN